MPKVGQDMEGHKSLDDQPLISLVSKPQQQQPPMEGRTTKIKKPKQPHEEQEPSAKKPRKYADGPTSEGVSGSAGPIQGDNPLRRAAVREAFAGLVVARLHGRPDPF